MNSTQSRRKDRGRTVRQVLADLPNYRSDLRADLEVLAATIKELRRINAAMRKALRHLQCVQARDADSAIILQTAFVELQKKRIKL